MAKIDFTGLAPEITAYISRLETQLKEQSKTVESQKVRIDQLMDTLARFQKSMYGQSSEKRKYVLGEDNNQLSLFNEAEAEENRHAPEADKVAVAGHTRKAKRNKEELTEDLPVVEILCELEDDKLVCEEWTENCECLAKKRFGKN